MRLGLRPRVIGPGQTSTRTQTSWSRTAHWVALVQSTCVYHIIRIATEPPPKYTSVKRVSDPVGKSSVHVAKFDKITVKLVTCTSNMH